MTLTVCEKHESPVLDISQDKAGTFSKKFEDHVLQTIEKYQLLNKEEKVLVAASGGKDSTVLLSILHKYNFNIEAITVDAHIGCYTQENLERLRKFCKELDIKLHEISFRKEFGASLCYLRDTLNAKGAGLKSCTVCGVLRRYIINKKAKELQPDKIATGHNADDEAQAFLMNVFKNNLHLSARAGPSTTKKEGFIQRVKPLYTTTTGEIIKYMQINKLPLKVSKCPCSLDSYRNSFKDTLNDLEQQDPRIKQKIVEYFLNIRPQLQKEFHSPANNNCDECNEPSSQDICRTCQILSKI